MAHRSKRDRRVRAFYRVTAAVLAPVVFLTLGTPLAAQAQDHREAAEVREVSGASIADDYGYDGPLSEELSDAIGDDLEYGEGLDGVDPETLEAAEAGVDAAAAAGEFPEGAEPAALPSGEASSAVTPQAISLPNAEGSIEGMGESFTPQLSSGTGTFSVPFALPAGRSGVQPSLGLAYSSSGGNTCVGFGWAFGAPYIARQTDRGLPRYIDDRQWHEEEDHFIYNGGQELVPVDSAEMATIDDSGHSYGAAAVPTDVSGWQQYRARIEGGFLRFFRDPDGERWVVQGKDGSRFDFGLLPVGEGPMDLDATNALQTEEDDPDARIYRWFLTRMSDAHGSTVYYRYVAHEGYRYLADVHYLSPASCSPGPAADPAAARACSSNLSDYGVRVAMTYEAREDVFSNYVPGWRVENGLRLKRVTVLAADETVGSRELVRRYHLTYDATSYHSLLSSVQVEGRPDTLQSSGAYATEHVAEGDVSTPFIESGGVAMLGRLLPAMTFDYTTMPTRGPSIPGFGGVDNTARTVTASPNVSVDAAHADLFDVNTDGLPDLIVTDPARYRMPDGSPAVGVFFNGFSGADARPAGQAAHFSDPVSVAMPAGLSGTLNLSNANIVPMDVDGDGRNDLLHMPRLDRYGYFTPSRAADAPGGASSVSPADQGWAFGYVDVELPRVGDDPRIDFVRDATHYKVFDVNNDHLVDVVRTTGTVMQTWLNLGWVPGGEGKFGQASWTGSSWELSTNPLETCLLHDGTPIDFGNPEIRLSDMNGDGIQDIVRIRRGDITWWPGRGAGVWGDGSASCRRGEGDAREVTVATPPRELNPDLSGVFLTDVNGDGATDVVQVRFRELDIWFSRGGESFTDRITVEAPMAPDLAPRIRFADIDGSATTDLIYGNADNWQYLDLMGGLRPRLLRTVHNGLGAETSMGYASSASDYLADLVEAESCADSSCEPFTWSHVPDTGCDAKLATAGVGSSCYRSGGSPVVSTVIREVSTNDHFGDMHATVVDNITTTRFAYHDGYYEGIEQEFRGFGAADAVSVGDELGPNLHPSQWTRTFFHQGRRPSDIASERLADNPREALKGREWMSETFDASGQYLSTSHSSCAVRKLATGLDGRRIVYAYVDQSDALSYDYADYAAGTDSISLPVVTYQEVDSDTGAVGASATPAETHSVAVRAAGWAWVRGTTDEVDNLGNVRRQVAHGRLKDQHDTGAVPIPYGEDIQSVSEPELINSAGQWIWRTRRGYVRDGAAGTPLGDTTNHFNDTGDLVYSTQVANLTAAAYDFTGDLFGAQDLAQANQTLEGSTSYGAWGEVLANCSGANIDAGGTEGDCLRYAEVDYDGAYAQLPTAERIAVNTSGSTCAAMAGGFCGLQTTATWDRGFGVLDDATDPNGQTSSVLYDGLGRMTSMSVPTMAGCATAALKVMEYHLVVDGQPASYVRSYDKYSYTGCGQNTGIETYSVVDGLGRARSSVIWGRANRWYRSDYTELTDRGQPYKSCNAEYITDATRTFDLNWASSFPSGPECAVQRLDAFSRPLESYERDDPAMENPVSRVDYHALSTDTYDYNDLAGDLHFRGTHTTSRTDGHGRAIEQILRNQQPDASGIEFYRLYTEHRADNAVTLVARFEGIDDAPVDDSTAYALNSRGNARMLFRTFTYDTAGRRVGTTDPDSDSRVTSGTTGTWRYLFNRVGDLTAVRDPRGCGQNFYYDHAGRLLGEDYVECDEAQPPGDVPDETLPSDAIGMEVIGVGTQKVDVRHFFDEEPYFHSTMNTATPAVPGADYPLGRLTGTSDRGQRSSIRYDARGNVTWTGRQMALIPLADASVPTTLTTDPPTVYTSEARGTTTRVFDEEHTYATLSTYDHQSRPLSLELPRDPDFDNDPIGGHDTSPQIVGRIRYTPRGQMYRMFADIDAVTYPIINYAFYQADGLPETMFYGDGDYSAGTIPIGWLREFWQYDERRRVSRHLVDRQLTLDAPDPSRPLGAVARVIDERLGWDGSDNLVSSQDALKGDAFPDGHRPARRIIEHDALYHVAHVELDYRQDNNVWTTADTAADWRDERTRTNADASTHGAVDPGRRRPAPMLPALASARVVDLVYRYDWLSNQTAWTDDAQNFYERSLGQEGQVGNGFDDPDLGNVPRPAALYFSSNISDLNGGSPGMSGDPTLDRGGWLDMDYGDGGNLVSMTVRAQCHDRDASTECHDDSSLGYGVRETFLRAQCVCDSEQHYQYRWDETNRLLEARRYDRVGSGNWNLEVRQRYQYDGSNVRTVKQTLDESPAMGDPGETVALYVYSGDFERRGLRTNYGVTPRYDASAVLGTETQYLVGPGRITWKQGTPAAGIDREHRVTANFGNLIRSTGAVVELQTGRILEMSTYYPNGARENHRTSDLASFSLEPVGFTGKEADEEVGLVYFGERYLVPRVGRWASPDPLEVHAPGEGGEFGNSYHYIAGDLLQARDPVGLNRVSIMRRLLRASGHVVNGRTVSNLRFAGSRVTTQMLRRFTNVARGQIDRLVSRYRTLQVPYNSDGLVDFHRATTVNAAGQTVAAATRGGRPVVFDTVNIGTFVSSAADIATAWTRMAARHGWSPRQLARMQRLYTMHHHYRDGVLQMVDRTVHDSFRHTGGDALRAAGLLARADVVYRGGSAGAAYVFTFSALAPETAQALSTEHSGAGDVAGAMAQDTHDNVNPFVFLGEMIGLAADVVDAGVDEAVEAATTIEDEDGATFADALDSFVDIALSGDSQ